MTISTKNAMNEKATGLGEALAALDLAGRLDLVASSFRRPVFTTSLGKEDQLLTAAIAAGGHADAIVLSTLQTGRLFAETLRLMDETEERYDLTIRRYEPRPKDVADYVARFGRDGFYESVEARKACCGIRKLVPLAAALKGADAWLTGLRRDQSEGRADVPFAEWDDARGLMKINPLADLSDSEMEAQLVAGNVAVNPLHARGYPSIGCEPCTRAVRPGEPARAGRWWWEQGGQQECGLHVEAQVAPRHEQSISKTA